MRTVAIDSRIGGMGDIWMRLLALYSLAGQTHCEVHLAVPGSLVSLGQQLFGDRLHVDTTPAPGAIAFTHLGLRHTWRQLLGGQSLIFPFFRLNEHDRKERTLKSRVNAALIELTALTGRVSLPRTECLFDYQGFMEMSAVRPFAGVSWAAFAAQAKSDLAIIRERLQERFPPQPAHDLMIFPSGSAHQALPIDWGRRHFPNAVYALFVQDPAGSSFAQAGLHVVTFNSVEGLLERASTARKILTTESFSSHVLQTYSPHIVVALTQQLPARIVHPGFDGKAIRSAAPCCPCRSLDRGNHPHCEMGHEFCVTWQDPAYSSRIQGALA